MILPAGAEAVRYNWSSLSIRVRLPEGSALLDATPEPLAVEGRRVIYRTVLDHDGEFRFHFRRGR